jgi:hypothetical protein
MSTAYAPVPARGEPGDEDRVELHCCGCGYGAVVARPPTRCPMCGRGAWRLDNGPAIDRLREEQAMRRTRLGYDGEGR